MDLTRILTTLVIRKMDRLVIGMVENKTKNPFNFKHFDVDYLSLYVDGKQVPSKQLTPDFTNELCTRSYASIPSHYVPGIQSWQLRHIRERARDGGYLKVRDAVAVGVHFIRQEEVAILMAPSTRARRHGSRILFHQ